MNQDNSVRRCIVAIAMVLLAVPAAFADGMVAGAAKVDITNYDAGPVNDPLYAKALVLQSGETTLAIITVDAVAIGAIGPIGDAYLGNVRGRLEEEFGIPPSNVLVNASHCHGVVRGDTDSLTVDAVREAMRDLEPVAVGVGAGQKSHV